MKFKTVGFGKQFKQGFFLFIKKIQDIYLYAKYVTENETNVILAINFLTEGRAFAGN